jgi:flagellar motor switch protein FliN
VEREGKMDSMDQATEEKIEGLQTAQPTTRDLLLDIELDATLRFGSRELALKEVLALGLGDVVELDRHVSEPVDLVVGDRIVARGEVVVVSGNFALLITEVAEPQMRLESIRCLF